MIINKTFNILKELNYRCSVYALLEQISNPSVFSKKILKDPPRTRFLRKILLSIRFSFGF